MDSISVDMHIHSNLSDGNFSVPELVESISVVGLKSAILTDHDRIDGSKDFISLCHNIGVNSMSGVEISTGIELYGKWFELHLLGYDFNLSNQDLKLMLEQNLTNRNRLSDYILEFYKTKLQIDFTLLNVANYLHLSPLYIHPYQIDYYIYRLYGNDMDEAHKRRSWFRNDLFHPQKVIESVVKASGKAVWAHPGNFFRKLKTFIDNPRRVFGQILSDFKKYGLNGLEIFTPHHNELELQQKMLFAAHEHDLFITGGSDYHGIELTDKRKIFVLGAGGIGTKEFENFSKR